MEMIIIILGLGILYAYIHGLIIISRNMGGMTRYEKAVVITALAAFVLTLIGNIN
jgi:hypothetical protein